MLHDDGEAIIRSNSDESLIRSLAAAYAVVWIAAAIAPLDRGDWLLENLLIFATVPVLALCRRVFVFSRTSYVLIFCFLVMHTYAAHYTYSLTPLGFWLQDLFDTSRNHFDRIVHFSFGLLLTYPLREIGQRVLALRSGWSYAVPLLVLLGLAGGYEIVEFFTARVVDPELGIAFLGTQGDEWDAQKDMRLALAGSAICLAASAAADAAGARARAS